MKFNSKIYTKSRTFTKIKQQILLTLILLLIIFERITGDVSHNEQSTIVSGITILPLEHKVVYQSSVPIYFHADWVLQDIPTLNLTEIFNSTILNGSQLFANETHLSFEKTNNTNLKSTLKPNETPRPSETPEERAKRISLSLNLAVGADAAPTVPGVVQSEATISPGELLHPHRDPLYPHMPPGELLHPHNRRLVGNEDNLLIGDEHLSKKYAIDQRSIKKLPNAYNITSESLISNQEYSLPSRMQRDIEGDNDIIPLGLWITFLSIRGGGLPTFLTGIEPHWEIIVTKFWPPEFLLALYESLLKVTLPIGHPDRLYKIKSLGILRLMSPENYDKYQELLMHYSNHQTSVPQGQELPMYYTDFRSLDMARQQQREYQRANTTQQFEEQHYLSGTNLTRRTIRNHLKEIRNTELLLREQLKNGNFTLNSEEPSLTTSETITENTIQGDMPFSKNMPFSLLHDPLLVKNRGKRSPSGILFSCCDVVYHSDIKALEVDRDELKFYMKQSKAIAAGEQTEINENKDVLKLLSNKTEDDMRIIQDKFKAAFERIVGEGSELSGMHDVMAHTITSINYLLLQNEYAKRNISLAECRSQHIPHFIVTQQLLLDDLNELAEKLKVTGFYELAIPISELGTYYRHPMAFCVKSNETLMVQLKVPLVRVKQSWRIHSLHIRPFVYNSSICVFEGLPNFIGVSSDKQIRYINPYQHSECVLRGYQLCFLEQFPTEYQPRETCVKKLFYGATVSEIMKVCQFTCVKHTEPLVTQLSSMKFSILNPTQFEVILQLTCDETNPNKNITIPKIGSYSLELPCSCNGLLISPTNNHFRLIKITPPYPCSPNDTKKLTIDHTIPIYWLKEKTYFVKDKAEHYVTSHDFNLSHLIDEDLSQLHGINIEDRLNAINITAAIENLDIPTLFKSTYGTTYSYTLPVMIILLYVWIGLLTKNLCSLTVPQPQMRSDNSEIRNDNRSVTFSARNPEQVIFNPQDPIVPLTAAERQAIVDSRTPVGQISRPTNPVAMSSSGRELNMMNNDVQETLPFFSAHEMDLLQPRRQSESLNQGPVRQDLTRRQNRQSRRERTIRPPRGETDDERMERFDQQERLDNLLNEIQPLVTESETGSITGTINRSDRRGPNPQFTSAATDIPPPLLARGLAPGIPPLPNRTIR
jgi:hypothetical protein